MFSNLTRTVAKEGVSTLKYIDKFEFSNLSLESLFASSFVEEWQLDQNVLCFFALKISMCAFACLPVRPCHMLCLLAFVDSQIRTLLALIESQGLVGYPSVYCPLALQRVPYWSWQRLCLMWCWIQSVWMCWITQYWLSTLFLEFHVLWGSHRFWYLQCMKNIIFWIMFCLVP